MDNKDKSRDQLLDELTQLRQRVKDMEKMKTEAGQSMIALRESETKFRMLADSTYDWAYWLDNDYHFVYSSPSCEQLTGFKPEEFINDDNLLFQIVHPEDKKRIIDHRKMYHTSHESGNAEYRILRKDGSVRWIEHVCKPILTENGHCLGRRSSNRDITDRKQMEITLQKVNRSLKVISECNSFLIRAIDEKDFLNDVCRIIIKNGDYYMVWVGLLDAGVYIIRPVAYAGPEPFSYAAIKIDLGGSQGGYKLLRTAMATGKFQKCQNLSVDQKPCFGPAPEADKPCRSIISLPLISNGDTIGALTIYSFNPNSFDEDEIKLLTEMTDDLAYGIVVLRTRINHKQVEEQVKTYVKKIENALEGTVNALAATSETRDPYTAGHQRRVTQLAKAIAQDMGFSEDRISAVRVAGLLHDIGKINIPSEILTKPSRLTDIEFALIKIHPQASYNILKSIEFPWPVAQIVLQHHEKLDGSGYPFGLKKDEILMEARILCVADIVEAMSSHRPYRPALGVDVALNDILTNKGILYDPSIVDACVKLFRDKGFGFE